MATATVVQERVVIGDGFFGSMARKLRTVGITIKNVAVSTGNFLVRSAKWIYRTAAVQWTVTKVAQGAGWIWGFLKTPVGFGVGTVAALIFAPKAVAIMLATGLLLSLTAIILLIVIYRKLSKDEGNGGGIWTAPVVDGVPKSGTKVTKETVTRIYPNSTETETTETTVKVDGKGKIEVEDVLPTGLITMDEDEVLNPDETLEDRFNFLDIALDAARDEQNHPLISELSGRMYLLNIRAGQVKGQLKKDAEPNLVYRKARQFYQNLDTSIDWDWSRMYNSVRAEDSRLKKVAKLKAEQANLTSV